MTRNLHLSRIFHQQFHKGLYGHELIEDEHEDSPIDIVIKKNREKYIRSLFIILDDQERDIIQQRFGLIDGEPKTLENIGKKYGVTRERIRQIEGLALNKLRRFMLSQDIKINELL